MSTAENTATLRRIFDECFNQGNLATADDLVSPDAQDLGPQIPPGVPKTGAETLKAVVPLLRTAFPDLHVTVDEIIGEGEAVVARSTWTGTHHGAFLGLPPTGKQVSWTGMDIVHVRAGTIVSHYGVRDALGLLHQLGALPSAVPFGG